MSAVTGRGHAFVYAIATEGRMGEIEFNRLTIGALARIAIICNLCLWAPLGLAFGVCAATGAATTRLNGQDVTGIEGFLVALLIAAMSMALGSCALILGGVVARLAAPLLDGQRLRLR